MGAVKRIIWATVILLMVGAVVYTVALGVFTSPPPPTWDDALLASLPPEWTLLAEDGWRVEIGGHRPPSEQRPGWEVLAWCRPATKTIILYSAPPSQTARENIIRHEIAHALHAETDPAGYNAAGYDGREAVAELWATGTVLPGASPHNIGVYARVELPPQTVVSPGGVRHQP